MPTGPAFAAGVAAAAVDLAPGDRATADAISALTNLGWKRPEASAAVARVAERTGEGAGLETLIREALKELAPR